MKPTITFQYLDRCAHIPSVFIKDVTLRHLVNTSDTTALNEIFKRIQTKPQKENLQMKLI